LRIMLVDLDLRCIRSFSARSQLVDLAGPVVARDDNDRARWLGRRRNERADCHTLAVFRYPRLDARIFEREILRIDRRWFLVPRPRQVDWIHPGGRDLLLAPPV